MLESKERSVTANLPLKIRWKSKLWKSPMPPSDKKLLFLLKIFFSIKSSQTHVLHLSTNRDSCVHRLSMSRLRASGARQLPMPHCSSVSIPPVFPGCKCQSLCPLSKYHRNKIIWKCYRSSSTKTFSSTSRRTIVEMNTKRFASRMQMHRTRRICTQSTAMDFVAFTAGRAKDQRNSHLPQAQTNTVRIHRSHSYKLAVFP